MTITVVTPWHNCHELADGYFAAMRDGLREGDRALIMDNGSEPRLWGTIHLREDKPENVVDVNFDRNHGFSRACNAGLTVAARMTPPPDAVLWLNNDVRQTAPGWLEPIRAELRPGVLVGAQLRADPHTAIDGRPIPYLDGWCLAGMRDDLLALGGFDEEYEEPAYFSDNDLCLRATAVGMKLVQVDVPLVHLGNYTSRRFDVSAVSLRNRARYEAKARDLLAMAA